MGIKRKIKVKKPSQKEIEDRLLRLEATIKDRPVSLATFSSDEEREAFTLGMIEGIRWTSGIK